MKLNGRILALLAVLLFFVATYPVYGQAEQQQPLPPEAQQSGPLGDPVRQLNLSPEQREQIRSIRQRTQAERAAINERVRETNRSLEEALDADSPDEALVEQRMGDAAAAQAASMRMRIMTEVRIRHVLTREQLGILRTLRQQARQSGRERQLNERQLQRRQGIDGSRSLQNERNGLGPPFPRRDNAPRKQQP